MGRSKGNFGHTIGTIAPIGGGGGGEGIKKSRKPDLIKIRPKLKQIIKKSLYKIINKDV